MVILLLGAGAGASSENGVAESQRGTLMKKKNAGQKGKTDGGRILCMEMHIPIILTHFVCAHVLPFWQLR